MGRKLGNSVYTISYSVIYYNNNYILHLLGSVMSPSQTTMVTAVMHVTGPMISDSY